jgi:hypothetical protein
MAGGPRLAGRSTRAVECLSDQVARVDRALRLLPLPDVTPPEDYYEPEYEYELPYPVTQRPAYNAAPSRMGGGSSPVGVRGRLLTRTEALAVQRWKRPRGLRTRPRTWPVPVSVRCLRRGRCPRVRQMASKVTSISASAAVRALRLTIRSPFRISPNGKTAGRTAVSDSRSTGRALAPGAKAPSTATAHATTSAPLRIGPAGLMPLVSAAAPLF